MCDRCGKVFCELCRLPENHGCPVPARTTESVSEKPRQPEKEPIRPPKLDVRKFSRSWKKMKENFTLKNFTLVSILFVFAGFLAPHIFPNDYQVLFQSILEIGVMGLILAYFFYALLCWESGNRARAVLMIDLPFVVYTLSSSKITESSLNALFYLGILFITFAFVSVIILYLSESAKHGIEKYLLRKTGRSRYYFYSKLSYSVIGFFIISLLVLNYGNIGVFYDNTGVITQSIVNTAKNSQYDSTVSPVYVTTQPFVTSPMDIITQSPTQVTTTSIEETGPTQRSFAYVLRGTTGTVKISLYSSVYSHITTHFSPSGCVRYSYDTSPCTNEEMRQYYLKYINEPTQKKYLDSLVKSIKAQSSNKDDQARVAISLVQQIPYDYSRLSSSSFDMRTPYEVLYDNKGVCSEKSVLLAYLLRELGYGVVLFEFPSESHMAVGIKCPKQYDFQNSGYAFIETANPSIPTDSQGDYLGVGKLMSIPNIYTVSEGVSFNSVSEEYQDALLYNQLINMGAVLDIYHYNQWVNLVQKYGIKTDVSSAQSSGSTAYSSMTYAPYLGEFCPVGYNGCEKDSRCYLPCPHGRWDAITCVCYY
jgi:hypothetical protein